MAALSIGLALALVTVFTGLASADRPTVVQVENPLPIVSGGFSPRALPRNELTPVAMSISGRIRTLGGTRPPALQELILELDRNVAIDAVGVPICRPTLPEQRLATVEESCHPALVGRGTMEVEVEFPEQKPFIAKSKLLAFNGGKKGGTTTIFIHAYLSAPVSAAVVTRVKVSKVHEGRYGTGWVFTFPKIAGGYGSITDFSLIFNKQFGFRGKRRSFLLAKCPDGHLDARATSIFSDGSEQRDTLARACTPKA